jgi:hypothetical protein
LEGNGGGRGGVSKKAKEKGFFRGKYRRERIRSGGKKKRGGAGSVSAQERCRGGDDDDGEQLLRSSSRSEKTMAPAAAAAAAEAEESARANVGGPMGGRLSSPLLCWSSPFAAGEAGVGWPRVGAAAAAASVLLLLLLLLLPLLLGRGLARKIAGWRRRLHSCLSPSIATAE